jgi:hypothetical protein
MQYGAQMLFSKFTTFSTEHLKQVEKKTELTPPSYVVVPEKSEGFPLFLLYF